MKITPDKRIGISILLSIFSLPLWAQGTENIIRWGDYMGALIPIFFGSVVGLILQLIIYPVNNKFLNRCSMFITFSIVGMTVFLGIRYELSFLMIFVCLLSLIPIYSNYKRSHQ